MAPFLDSSSFFVEFWLNGLYYALVLSTLHMIVTSKKISVRRKIWQTSIIVVPYICSTIHMATIWLKVRNAINDNEAPTGGGVLGAITQTPAWATGLSLASFALNICLADCIVIWRCWTVWGRQWVVVVLPILCSITGAVIRAITVADQVSDTLAHESMEVAHKSKQFVTFSTVFFSLSIATSLMTALLIAARILSVQRVTGKAGIQARNTFNSTIEIVVESAATYSVTLLVLIISLTRHRTPTSEGFSESVHSQIAGIAPLMIIYRIVAKHARPDEDWETDGVMSAVKFAHSAHGGGQGGSFQSEDERNTVVVIGTGSGMSATREKNASSESV